MSHRFQDLPLDLMRRVDQVSDQFEAAMWSGAAPRIDAYLRLVPNSARLALLDELLAIGRLTVEDSFDDGK
jgi:hypothetical protein